MPKNAITKYAAVAALLTGLWVNAAGAAELKLVSPGAMRGVLQELVPGFEKTSGHKVAIEYATSAKIEEKVAASEEIDVAIVNKPRADKLIRDGKLVGGTATNLAALPIGAAVKTGAPKPDIGSVDAFKKVLAGAKSIAYTDPASGATSGTHVAQTIDKLGLTAELQPKIRLGSPDPGKGVGDLVAKGDAEIGILPISELMQIAGIDIVGPLPADFQTADLTFVAAVPMVSEQPMSAKALIDFLATPEAKRVYKAKGMEPG